MIERRHVNHRMSETVAACGLLRIGGQVADVWDAGIEEQTADVLAQVDALLAEHGLDRTDLVMVNVYLASIADCDAMNRVYDRWVDRSRPPARICVEARLADPELRVEVTAVAALDADGGRG